MKLISIHLFRHWKPIFKPLLLKCTPLNDTGVIVVAPRSCLTNCDSHELLNQLWPMIPLWSSSHSQIWNKQALSYVVLYVIHSSTVYSMLYIYRMLLHCTCAVYNIQYIYNMVSQSVHQQVLLLYKLRIYGDKNIQTLAYKSKMAAMFSQHLR